MEVSHPMRGGGELVWRIMILRIRRRTRKWDYMGFITTVPRRESHSLGETQSQCVYISFCTNHV